jgi:hypothetical protein
MDRSGLVDDDGGIEEALGGSLIDRLVDDGIEVRREPLEVHAGSAPSGVRDHGAGHESSRRHGTKLGHGDASACYDDRLSGLNFAEHLGKFVAELPLRDGSAHAEA